MCDGERVQQKLNQRCCIVYLKSHRTTSRKTLPSSPPPPDIFAKERKCESCRTTRQELHSAFCANTTINQKNSRLLGQHFMYHLLYFSSVALIICTNTLIIYMRCTLNSGLLRLVFSLPPFRFPIPFSPLFPSSSKFLQCTMKGSNIWERPTAGLP